MNANKTTATMMKISIFLLHLLGLSVAAATVTATSSTSNTPTFLSGGSRGTSSLLRFLKDDSHDHDDLAHDLKWSGIFKFSPGTIYNLSVKLPSSDQDNSDPHAGHNHRRRVLGRTLQEEDDHSEEELPECHCHGSDIHCSTSQAEQHCECHDHDGVIEVHCKAVDDSCHCDGSHLHCSAGEDVASDLCQCSSKGSLQCIGEEEEEEEVPECHCDGSDIHCSTSQAEQHCECHDHDGVIEVHCKAIDDSCHCDGSQLHCSAGEDVASDLCQCSSKGSLQCIGHETSEVEDHFLLALIPVENTWEEGIDEAFEILEGMEGNAIQMVSDGDTIVATTQHAYELSFDDDDGGSTNTLSFVNLTQENYVLFLPTVPSQVSDPDIHFLVDENGTKVWAETARYSFEPDPRDGEKPWGTVIGATLLVNLVTLTGVIFLVPMLTTAFKNRTIGQAWIDLWSSTDIHLIGGRTQQLFDIFITAFACGALLATTVFLIIPEAIILVNDEGEEDGGGDSHEGHNHRMLQEEDPHAGHDHGNKNWVFGASVLAGFLFPMVLASFFPHHHLEDEHNHSDARAHETVDLNLETSSRLHPTINNNDVDNGIKSNGSTVDIPEEKAVDSENKADDQVIEPAKQADDHVFEPKKKEINKRLVCGIIVGDALHNFADGVFIGAAFLLCGNSLGWTVLAGTIYHELAQEVSDFFVLTTHAHLPPIKTLILNFVSGLSVTLGGIIVLATNVSNYALGVILSMSAGVYINVAAKECMPVVERLAVTIGDRLLAFLAFAIGAIPIGLVLLNHQHCEA